MRESKERARGWPRKRALFLTLLVVGVLGCTPLGGDRATAPEAGARTARVSVALQVAAQATSKTATLSAYYRTGGVAGTIVPIARAVVTLEPGLQAVPIPVDLAPCLGDATGPRTTDGACPLFVAVALRDVADALVDSVTIGPLLARPGAALSPAPVTLAKATQVALTVPDTLRVGDSLPVQAVVRDSAGTVLERPVEWSSSDPTRATVTTEGRVRALQPGAVTITARAFGASGSVSRAVLVDVNTVSLTLRDTVRVTDTLPVTATLRDRQGQPVSGPPVTWTSSAPAVATLDNTGRLVALAPGAVTLTAESQGRVGSITRTVLADVAAITLNLPDTVRVNDTVQVSATVTNRAGQPVPNAAVTYGTTTPTVATLSSTGRLIALAPGSATITATSAGRTATATRTIVPSIGSITLGLADTADARATVTATATVRNAAGQLQTGVPITWTSSNPNVATIATNGTITTLTPGQTVIRAATTTLSANRVLTVAWRCDGRLATVKNGVFTANDTWAAAQSPILVPDSAVFTNQAVLSIGPGTTVCFERDQTASRLRFADGATLQAIGTESQPIVLRPREANRSFRAPEFVGNPTGSSVVRFARLLRPYTTSFPFTPTEIQAAGNHPVTWESVVVSSAFGVGLLLTRGSSARSVTIDSSLSFGYCMLAYDHATLDKVTLRNCANTGLVVAGRSVELADVDISRTPIGLRTFADLPASATSSSRIPRMSSIGQTTMQVSATMLSSILPDSLSQATLRGAAPGDTVQIIGGGIVNTGVVTVYGHLQWLVTGRLDLSESARLVARPGVVLTMAQGAGISILDGARAQLVGSSSAPVRMRPRNTQQPWDILFFNGTGISRISNAIIEGGSGGNPWMIWTDNPHQLVIDSSSIRGARKGSVLSQSSAGVSVFRTIIDGAEQTPNVTEELLGGNNLTIRDVRIVNARTTGARFGGTANIDGLEVTGSTVDGIRVAGFQPVGSSFARVNVFGNGGVGVRNLDPVTYTFSGFWWGDPSGPNGPQGDGAAGNLLAPSPATSAHSISTSAPPSAPPAPRGSAQSKRRPPRE